MKRVILLVGAMLMLAAGSGTATADNFAVVRPKHGTPGSHVAGAIGFSTVAATPISSTQLRGIWQAAGATYGIPWEVLAAINKVETNFGRNLGPSSAGAVGWMQFMPSTWQRWGMDANGDGVADPNNPTDAIFSAARYLAACGGQFDLPRAIYCYNHADWYVNEVLGLAAAYSRNGGQGIFSLGQFQTSRDAARRQIAATKPRIHAALAQARKLGRAERRFLHTAATATLIADRLNARKQAVQLGVRRDGVMARVSRLRRLLTDATQQANAVPFTTGAGSVMGWQFSRIDQGVDVTSSLPFSALATGTVVYVDPNFWKGTPAVYEKLDQPITVNGRTYDEIYYSETKALVHEGQRLVAGEPVIAPGSAEIGFASGNLPAAHGSYREGRATQAGRDFYGYITSGTPGSAPDPLFTLSSPLSSFQQGSVGFTSNIVYFTH